LLECMGYDPVTLDALIERSSLTAESLSSMLLVLELEGKVASLPGGRYQRLD
jgi:DNA processing protein